MRRAWAACLLVACALGALSLSGEGRAAAPGLIAAYAFDEGEGAVAADASGNDHGAALQGVAWSDAGRHGGALAFDGAASVGEIPAHAELDLSAGMTIEAWVRPEAVTGTATIVAKTRAGGRFPYGLELDEGRPAGFAVVDGEQRRALADAPLTAGTWQFVATTFDGAVVRTFVDGKQVAEAMAPGAIEPSDGPLALGANTVHGEHFGGAIDDVRVYARALSPAELATDAETDVAADDREPTPAPQPEPEATPAASARDCMARPAACGFPDVGTVGVPPGTKLEPASGLVVLSEPGAVYENKELTGSITVTAPDVTIRNVRLIATDDWYGIRSFGDDADTSGLRIEDSEIDLNGKLEIKGIGFDNYTAERVFFHNGSDCAHLGNEARVLDSLCVVGPDKDGDAEPDDTAFCDGDEHFDGLQSDGGTGIVIRGNTIRNPCGQTSAILMSSNTSPIEHVEIVGNLLAGGGYSLYCNAGPDVRDEIVTGNRFAGTYHRAAGAFGPTAGCEDADTFDGNLWDATAEPVE